MKKSELRSLIRECVQEILSEAFLLKKFKDFVGTEVPQNLRDQFITSLYPFFHKTAENPAEQETYVKKMIDAAIGKQLSPQDVAYFKNHDLDLSKEETRRMLTKFHPFLSKFLRYVQQTG